ncbi:histidine phosphatase family protein [Bacillaceae bacterium IKA-2]|nr:histidine phosphatase family protein [Bacillaceae bacterium IKA-2]
MDDIVSVTLLRHGITKENQQRRYIGWTDPDLEDSAITILKTSQLPAHFDVIYASDLKRCTQTANYYAPNETVIKDERLRELHFGFWEGKTYEDLKTIKLYRDWIDSPFEISPPSGESYFELKARVLDVWQTIITSLIEKQANDILIVSHGGPIRLLLTLFADTDPKKEWWDWPVKHLSGYRLFWPRAVLLKGGPRCISSQVEPFMVKNNG